MFLVTAGLSTREVLGSSPPWRAFRGFTLEVSKPGNSTFQGSKPWKLQVSRFPRLESPGFKGPNLGTSTFGGPKPWNLNVWEVQTLEPNPRCHPLQAQILRNTPFERRRPFATPGASRRRRPRRKNPWKKFARVSPFPYPLRGFLGVSIVLNRPFSTFSSSSSGAPGRSAAHPSLFFRRLVDGVPGLGTRLWRVSALPGIVVVVVVGSQNLPPKKTGSISFPRRAFPSGPWRAPKRFSIFRAFLRRYAASEPRSPSLQTPGLPGPRPWTLQVLTISKPRACEVTHPLVGLGSTLVKY